MIRPVDSNFGENYKHTNKESPQDTNIPPDVTGLIAVDKFNVVHARNGHSPRLGTLNGAYLIGDVIVAFAVWDKVEYVA